jgi:2-polyprenyl-3-methyl-5-hydroxy-6-metoxy-1,4-benzoquinol methylase
VTPLHPVATDGNADLAGEAYWSSQWESMRSYRPIDVEDGSLLNHMNRQFDALFARYLAPVMQSGGDLLEIGCARSEWLPYFSRRFGLRVHGLDYSDVGCRQAEVALQMAGVPGEIRHGDMFAPPVDWLGRFDVVMSWGLVEHFEDTGAALGAVARFARPGGLVLTVVPNMVGTVGLVQRLLNRPVFDLHVPVSAMRLRDAAAAAGLEVLHNDWFGASNFWVANLNGLDQASVAYWLKRQALRGVCALSVGSWLIERLVGPLPATEAFAPYIVSIARRPAAAGEMAVRRQATPPAL